MEQMLTLDDLERRGWTRSRIKRAESEAEIVKLRRGHWFESDGSTARGLHLARLRAALDDCHPDCVASHVSAAVLWQLPLRGDLGDVWLTRDGRGGGRVRSGVHQVRAPLAADDVTSINGIPVTNLARTVIDLSRTTGLLDAVMAADAALHCGLTRSELDDVLARVRRWPGSSMARRVVALADGRAESPYESWVRLRLDELGLPSPIPQHVIRAADGSFVARVDLAYPQWRLAIEYDGEAKYDELAGGLRPAEVFAREKQRDRRLAAEGWQVLHLSKRDVHDAARFASVIRAAIRAASLSRPVRCA